MVPQLSQALTKMSMSESGGRRARSKVTNLRLQCVLLFHCRGLGRSTRASVSAGWLWLDGHRRRRSGLVPAIAAVAGLQTTDSSRAALRRGGAARRANRPGLQPINREMVKLRPHYTYLAPG